MKNGAVVITFFFLLFGLGSPAKLPESWKRCKVSPAIDHKRNKCIEEAITQVIKDLDDEGEKNLGMGDIDPLFIPKLSIGTKNDGRPVSMAVDFKNMDLIGLSNFKMKSIKGKLSSPKDWSIRIEGFMKQMVMLGDYKIDGKVLVLPIVGSGKANVTYEHVNADGTIYGQIDIRDGKEYLKLTDQHVTFNIKRFYVHLDNLFNGDKALGDAMNSILNDNWVLVYDELKPSMEQALAKRFAKYSKPILEKIPFKDIFIVD